MSRNEKFILFSLLVSLFFMLHARNVNLKELNVCREKCQPNGYILVYQNKCICYLSKVIK